MKRAFSAILLAVFLGLFIIAVTSFAQVPVYDDPIVPMIPKQNRNDMNRVFLERAEELYTAPNGAPYIILVGDVQFRRGPMYMFCDSCHFYDTSGSFDAFGNVRMRQGDTLFVYADTLIYNNPKQTAILLSARNKNVKLINKDVTLTTDVFNYDLAHDLGYYDVGGVVTDKVNRLTSTEGEYCPKTKEAIFRDNVKLVSRNKKDTLIITTDYLYYNTYTHIAEMNTPSTIQNADGIIHTSNARYNTNTGQSYLYSRSEVTTKNGNTLVGDTILYNRKRGFGEVFGQMEINDYKNKLILRGDYGFYNEMIDSAFVTGHAYGIEYSTKDTIHMHGDSIRAFRIIKNSIKDSLASIDTIRYVIANPRVKFFRNDVQGLCDSMTFVTQDTMLYMDRFPILWSDNRQISGDAIDVHFNDSTAEWSKIHRNALVVEHIEDEFYNQLSGKEMVAFFEDKTIKHLDVEGNVLTVTFPEENDSTYNKVLNLESSFLSADFKDETIEKMKLWPQTNATVTPLYLAKKSIFYLPQFHWYEQYRPTYPLDIFNFPEELLAKFASAQVYERPVEIYEDKTPPTPVVISDEIPDVGKMILDNVSQKTEEIEEKVKDDDITSSESDEVTEELLNKKDEDKDTEKPLPDESSSPVESEKATETYDWELLNKTSNEEPHPRRRRTSQSGEGTSTSNPSPGNPPENNTGRRRRN